MSRYLQKQRGFEPEYGRSPMYYHPFRNAAWARNTRPARYTSIPRWLQPRLMNPPRAVERGWVFPDHWVKRFQRISGQFKKRMPRRIVCHN